MNNETKDVSVRAQELASVIIANISDAQELVHFFAQRNKWDDQPTVDKFDHLHEELIEMSKHLRYKSPDERTYIIKAKHDIFLDGIGDLFFGICRLANQLDVDVQEAFNLVKGRIFEKYDHQGAENKIIREEKKF